MLKVGIISNAYRSQNKFGIDFEGVIKDGFDCIDYQDFIPPKSFLYDLTDEEFTSYLTELKEELSKNNLYVNQLHSVWQANDETEKDFNESFKLRVKALKGASLLNCPYVVYHPTPFPDGWEDVEPDKKVEANIKMFKELLPYAEKYNVVMCLENLPFRGTKLSSVKTVKYIIDSVNSKYLKACLDTGHTNVLGEDIGEDIRLLGKDLKVLHVHDNNGDGDYHLLPFEGTVKWDEFKKALKEIGFNGCLSFETNVKQKLEEKSNKNHKDGKRYLTMILCLANV